MTMAAAAASAAFARLSGARRMTTARRARSSGPGVPVAIAIAEVIAVRVITVAGLIAVTAPPVPVSEAASAALALMHGEFGNRSYGRRVSFRARQRASPRFALSSP